MRAEVVQQHKAAIENPRGNHHIRVHSPVGKLQPLRQNLPPAFRLTTWILVADQKSRFHFFEECFQRIIRRTAQHKSHAPLGCVLLDVSQPLLQKVVMPQVRVGIAWESPGSTPPPAGPADSPLRWPHPARDYPNSHRRAASSKRRTFRPCAASCFCAPARGAGWQLAPDRRESRDWLAGNPCRVSRKLHS